MVKNNTGNPGLIGWRRLRDINGRGSGQEGSKDNYEADEKCKKIGSVRSLPMMRSLAAITHQCMVERGRDDVRTWESGEATREFVRRYGRTNPGWYWSFGETCPVWGGLRKVLFICLHQLRLIHSNGLIGKFAAVGICCACLVRMQYAPAKQG